MKASFVRHSRRRKRTFSEGSFFKKENQDPGFFIDPANTQETFFHAASGEIQRMDADNDQEEKLADGASKKKDDEPKRFQKEKDRKEKDQKVQQKDNDKREEQC